MCEICNCREQLYILRVNSTKLRSRLLSFLLYHMQEKHSNVINIPFLDEERNKINGSIQLNRNWLRCQLTLHILFVCLVTIQKRRTFAEFKLPITSSEAQRSSLLYIQNGELFIVLLTRSILYSLRSKMHNLMFQFSLKYIATNIDHFTIIKLVIS